MEALSGRYKDYVVIRRVHKYRGHSIKESRGKLQAGQLKSTSAISGLEHSYAVGVCSISVASAHIDSI